MPFDPPLYETFAFITRRNAHLSPATRAFIEVAQKRVGGPAARIDAERDAAQGSNGKLGSPGATRRSASSSSA